MPEVKRWYTALMLGAKVEGWDAHEVVLYTDAVKMQREAFVDGAKFYCDGFAGEYRWHSEYYKKAAARRYKEE